MNKIQKVFKQIKEEVAGFFKTVDNPEQIILDSMDEDEN